MNEERELILGLPEDTQEREVLPHVAGSEAFAVKVEPGTEAAPASLRDHGKKMGATLHAQQHGRNKDEVVFSEEQKPIRKIEGLERKRYFVTGSLWFMLGLVFLAADNVTGHIFDSFWAFPELATAFCLYHGYKQFSAAWFKKTARDLTFRGTVTEVKDKAHQVIAFVVNWVKEKIGLKKKKDLRTWKTG